MAHEIGWLVDGRVIYQRYYGVVTLDELVDASGAVGALVDDGVCPVHTLIDIVGLKEYPGAIGEIRRALRDARFDARLGWLVLVGVHPIPRYIASVVIQVTGLRFRLFDTFEEGLHFLATHDETLDELTPIPAGASVRRA